MSTRIFFDKLICSVNLYGRNFLKLFDCILMRILFLIFYLIVVVVKNKIGNIGYVCSMLNCYRFSHQLFDLFRKGLRRQSTRPCILESELGRYFLGFSCKRFLPGIFLGNKKFTNKKKHICSEKRHDIILIRFFIFGWPENIYVNKSKTLMTLLWLKFTSILVPTTYIILFSKIYFQD